MLREGHLVADETPEALLARAGRCVELTCEAGAADRVRDAILEEAGVLRTERAETGVIAYLGRGGSPEALVRRAMQAAPLAGFRIRSPNLVEVFRALDAP